MTPTAAVSVPQPIADAFRSASERTGTEFDFLLKTAIRESTLDPAAKPATSSATGLFQFVEQTWFDIVKETGPQHGLAQYAAGIERAGGRYEVTDPEARREILALRADPEVSAVMAGELARRNAAEMARALGREPSDGELYLAHFLGAGGAGELVRAAAEAPRTPAADLFPAAARANRTVFFEPSGAKRSVSEVYARLVRRHDGAAAAQPAPRQRTPINPFAAIAAFFERLFAPFAPPAATRPNESGSVRAAGFQAVNRPHGAHLGAASSAATDVPAADPAGPGSRPSPAATPGSWTWNLFTNAPVREGPLVLVDLTDRG